MNVCMAISIFKLLDKGMDNRPDTVAYGLADLPQRLFGHFLPDDFSVRTNTEIELSRFMLVEDGCNRLHPFPKL